MAPGQIDPVVAMAGKPWFIGRICDLSGPAPTDFARVLKIDTGTNQRIPAPWIVEWMGEGGLVFSPLPHR